MKSFVQVCNAYKHSDNWTQSPHQTWRWRHLSNWPRNHSTGRAAMSQTIIWCPYSQTGENFNSFAVFLCDLAGPSLIAMKGLNQFSEYVFGVDTIQTLYKDSFAFCWQNLGWIFRGSLKRSGWRVQLAFEKAQSNMNENMSEYCSPFIHEIYTYF